MKNIYSIGINHKTAPIAVRETFFLNSIQQDLFLSELKNNPAIIEAFVLSTCNRTEVYLHALENTDVASIICRLISEIKKIADSSLFKKHFYVHQNEAAVQHLFRVASGLDSLVMGEKQILGQVKNSLERARNRSMFSKKFNILSNLTLRVAKKAQAETQISHGGSSISWAAIAKAETVLKQLEGKNILLIGAGKMGELTAEQIHSKKFNKVYLLNRTEANAKALAESYGGEAVGFMEMREVLAEVDLCVCSSGAPHYILEKRTVEKIMPLRNYKPLLFIDISMPRNIDPEVAGISNVSLYAIDDLNQVVESNLKMRESAIHEVEAIIVQKMQEYHKKMYSTSPQSSLSNISD